MSLHIMYDYICSKCEAYYIPYEKEIVCPNCGNNAEDIYNISSICVRRRPNLGRII